MDRAAEAIREEMPWLKMETADDLRGFIVRHREYRRHRGRVAEWWWERRVV